MESPGSGTAMSSTDSSSADSSSTDSSPAQALSSLDNPPSVAMETNTTTNDDADSDSDSDISMSTDSDDEEKHEKHEEPGEAETSAPTQVAQNSTVLTPAPSEAPHNLDETTKKRKLSASEDEAIDLNEIHHSESSKRLKLDVTLQKHRTPEGHLQLDRSLLPAEIWHRVFTFCSPRVLGVLLQVNKSFNAYLDPSSSGSSYEPLSISAIQILPPASIWRASRLLFNMPNIPSPLVGKSELDMWKLACGTTCQFCGKKRQQIKPTPGDQWHPGPGDSGVVPIWSFEIRTCGPCLQNQTMKEIDLLLSSSVPSPLLAALPFVFLSNELHVLSPATLQSGQPPQGVQVTKHYYTVQIDAIKVKFEEVTKLGAATAEEWLKGLAGQGQEKKNEAARWERWEMQGGVNRMRNLEKAEALSKLLQMATRNVAGPPSTNGNISLYQPNGSVPTPLPLLNTSAPQMPMSVQNFVANAGPPRFASPAPNGFASYNSRPVHKHERTKEEVAEMKLARKAEIERRCMLLNPPIKAAVLAHMPSFQATLQIVQPVTDSSWEVLKPRLLAQVEEAEQREKDRLAQILVVQEQERRFLESQARSTSKDPIDREWDEFQAPLRARLGGYCDEIIRDGWNGGHKVSQETAPRFAADVLIYVRKRFYAELAKDEAAIRATGREPEPDPPNGPYNRKLILENMKWVFEAKIKPITEQYRKELFLCNACEYASKYYGFEGVIQHFAAKHTNALSSGSVVVHWKSEWPEYPPFNPDPSNMTVKPYYPTAPVSMPYSSAPPAMQPNYGYGGYQPATIPITSQAPPSQGYQENMGSYYGNSQYADQYSNQNGSYTQPSYQDGYQATQYPGAPPQTTPGYHDASQGYVQQNYGGQYDSNAQGMYAPPHSAPVYPSGAQDVTAQQQPYVPPAGEYGSSYSQPDAYSQPTYSPAPQKTEEYAAKLHDLAKNARNIWNSIGNVKEVPGSVKVYTIIYHILQIFRSAYQEDPPLSMIVDGLSNNKDMRPVRNVNGLLCKACSLGMPGSKPNQQKKQHFSFPQLVNHFHSVHEQAISHHALSHTPDWTTDMVILPDNSKLRSIVNAPGMDDHKLKLFTDALPEIITVPEVKTEPQNGFPYEQYQERAGPAYAELAPSQDNHEKYYTNGNSRPAEPESVQQDSGEYDPRNPATIASNQAPVYKIPRGSRHQDDFIREEEPAQRYRRYDEEPHRERYERPYAERRPSSSYGVPVAEYGRVLVRDEAPIYVDRQPRYRDAGEVEYRVRREPRVLRYEDAEVPPPMRDFRAANTHAFQSNRDDTPPVEMRTSNGRPGEGPAAQQSRITDVVAQISQHAQQARENQPARTERVDTGSEDGEVRVENGKLSTHPVPIAIDDASNAAERFLDNFRPDENMEGAPKALPQSERRSVWEADINASIRARETPAQILSRIHDYMDAERTVINGRRVVAPGENEYVSHGRDPRPSRTYAYDDRYVSSAPEPVARGRSPELVDHRYKPNNVVYRDERQGSSNGMQRTPSRFARYESIRLENDRARSRSPVYVKMGQQPGPYRERSPGAPPLRQEPMYRARTPQAGDDVDYERPPPPRPEYYRVYADEPRPRYAAEPAYEFVRVADPAGDYMIRRPVRREPEPVYYEDEVYRQPVYESRPPPRQEPQYERAEPRYEEYDPREPVPGPAPVSQARY